MTRTGTSLRSPAGGADIFMPDQPERFPFLELQYDPLYAFLCILQLLTLENKTLHEIKLGLPKSNIMHTSVYCPPDEKGAVMRILVSDIDQTRVEHTDGIRINEDDAWLLALPDALNPMIHLYGEGDTIGARDAIIKKYSVKIKKYLDSV